MAESARLFRTSMYFTPSGPVSLRATVQNRSRTVVAHECAGYEAKDVILSNPTGFLTYQYSQNIKGVKRLLLYFGGEGQERLTVEARLSPARAGATCIVRALDGHRPKRQMICLTVSTLIIWRRGRDSNPRTAKTANGFQDRRIRPLCHLSYFR